MIERIKLTTERLRKLLHYNPDTGEFRWVEDRGRKAKAGSVAGTIERKGYRVICVHGKTYKAHRLAWLYVTGSWPQYQLDHRNRNKSDNRFCNLREATQSQNMGNQPCRKNNKLGLRGVCFHRGMYLAQLKTDGINKHIGKYRTPGAAHAAYCEAARKHFGEFARAS